MTAAGKTAASTPSFPTATASRCPCSSGAPVTGSTPRRPPLPWRPAPNMMRPTILRCYPILKLLARRLPVMTVICGFFSVLVMGPGSSGIQPSRSPPRFGAPGVIPALPASLADGLGLAPMNLQPSPALFNNPVILHIPVPPRHRSGHLERLVLQRHGVGPGLRCGRQCPGRRSGVDGARIAGRPPRRGPGADHRDSGLSFLRRPGRRTPLFLTRAMRAMAVAAAAVEGICPI